MHKLAEYRIESARERLVAAKDNMDLQHYKISIVCCYYAIFNAMRALLAQRGVEFSKHSGVISYFRREYIKTGIFDERLSDYLRIAFKGRNECDYVDYITIDKETAEEQYAHAEVFVNEIRRYLEKEYGS